MKTFRHHSLPQYRMQSYYGPYRPQSSHRIRNWLTAFILGFTLALLSVHGCST